MLQIFLKLLYLEQWIVFRIFLWCILLHVTYIKVPHDPRELTYTNDTFYAITTRNWILIKPLWGPTIVFHYGNHEDNTEEIYEITFINILPLLCVEWSINVFITDNRIQFCLFKYWPTGFDVCVHWVFEYFSPMFSFGIFTTLLSGTDWMKIIIK